MTPADPFAPFDPADPFREYRAGVDAARLRYFPGPLAEVELVVRPSDTPTGQTMTAAARTRGVVAGWEYSAWGGVVHDGAAIGLGASGGLGRVAVRFEGTLRDVGGDLVSRGTIGVDTRLTVGERDLYVVLEYQRDELGAGGPQDLIDVVRSDAFARGELQTLGRNVAAVQGTYQLHPLVSADALILWNLNDPSALFAPGVSYSVSGNAQARLGVFVGAGRGDPTPDNPLPSELGLTPTIVYGSLSLFF